MTDSQVARQLRRSVINSLLYPLLFLLPWTSPMFGQSSAVSAASASVPHLVKFSGTVPGNPHNGVVGITFALYKEEQGGAPLWLETQNVQADSNGHYTVYLGATKSDGLPQELFVTGEARWLGVQPEGQAEQARTLLLSVPYALKAGDAETVGGLPASAFVLAAPGGAVSSGANNSAAGSGLPPALGGGGTVNFIPLWTPDGNTLGNSVLFQSGTGGSAKTGINTITPAATLDVNGGVIARGAVQLPSKGTATAGGGFASQPFSLQGSAFNSSSQQAIGPLFQWQTEPSANNSANPAGTLNLLYGNGSGSPGETGLNIASNGQIKFASGQTFPGAGTITGITAGTGLTGGGTSGNVTLSINVPFANQNYARLKAPNTFSGTQTVNGGDFALSSGNFDLPLTTNPTSGVITMAGTPFIHACCSIASNVFVGMGAGNFSTTGTTNTAVGTGALAFNTTGSANTASGGGALSANTTGSSNTAAGLQALAFNNAGGSNTANGFFALLSNTSGNNNTALGSSALAQNVTGSSNTALGYNAGPDSSHTNLTNATAIGANSVVSASNALVLGGTGSNAVSVGIGTATPASTLDVHGNANFTGPITFAPSQTFPGTGTITGVTAGTDLVGGGSSGSVTLNVDTTKVVTGVLAGTDLTGGGTGGVQTLNLDTTKVPQLNAANNFTGNQTVNGNLTSTGVVTASSYQIGSNLFAFGGIQNENAFLGFAGNTTTTGVLNTASGVLALLNNSTGSDNTASGAGALQANSTGNDNTATGSGALFRNTTGIGNTASGANALVFNTTGGANTASGDDALELNTTGESNTASGAQALYHNNGDYNTGSGLNVLENNTTGSSNTASGVAALFYNATGDSNTALGTFAGPDSAHPGLSNSTAIGANAEVTASNALVLGSINGVNGATADTFVGIGTTAPVAKLDVHGNANFTGPITFASGQTFPNTISGVTAGTDLTGGGSTGNVTLNVDTTKVVTGVIAGTDLTGGGTGGVQTLSLDTTKVPQLAAANTFTNNQTVNGNLTATGTVSGNSFLIGGNLFAFGNFSSQNAFLGFGGTTATTGSDNVAIGFGALNQTTGGTFNTAVGADSLQLNVTGSGNTALGPFAGPDVGHPALTNSTAIGGRAQVTASNAMVLGSINGVNGAIADTSVGIGTTAPASTLDVEANAPALVGPILLLKNKAPVQAGLGNSVDLRFALDGGSSVGNPNAFIRAAEDGNNQYGSWISFNTMADGGAAQGAVERMRIRSDGLVGIGTSIPDALLTVNGGADKPSGGSWATFSDRRLKNLDGDYQAGLNEVLKLHPVRYRYKDGNGMGINDREEHIGFVAQDVQKVIPEAVTENSKGYLLVNNDPILWTMLNAIKEQQREFQQQQAELARALRQIKQQQSVLRTQAAAMQRLKTEVHETRESLRKVKAQVAAAQPTLVAAK